MTTRPMRLAVPLLALAVACTVDNDASIEIYAVCGPPEDSVKCQTTGKCDTLLADRAWAATRRESGSTNSFDMYVQVNNRLSPNDDESTFRLNTNDFTIDEYRLSFESNPALVIPDFVVPANHAVPASGSTTPLIPLIPFEIMRIIDAQDPVYVGSVPMAVVEVELKVFGHTRDGSEIETGPFVVPVDVLDGIALDPVCVNTTDIAYACPHAGQTHSKKCSAAQ